MARPLKLTPEVEKAICDAIRETGCSVEASAAAAGVSASALFEWQARGRREASGLFVQFVEALTRAREASELTLVRSVLAGGERDWRAAAFLLERRFPERYGRQRIGEAADASGAVVVYVPERSGVLYDGDSAAIGPVAVPADAG